MLNPASPEWREISWERALAAANPGVASLLDKALTGVDLGMEEGLTLARVEDNDLLALVKVADEIRRRVVGDKITYVVNRNLNFTNVCIVGCAFCGFSRGPDSPDAYFHSTETLVAKSVEAVELGATEVCIQGGLPKDLDGFYYVQLLRAIKARLPELHIHAYSPMEITYGVEKTRMPLRDYLLMLKEAGLNSIPGTAAEILDDSVRKSLSPNKLKVRQWIEIIRTAHSRWHSLNFDNDVWPYGTTGTLGETSALAAGNPKRNTRIYRICSTGFHPFPDQVVPNRRRPRRAFGPRRSDRSCSRPNFAEWLHSQYSSFLGQAGL